nr:hypothetical protein [Tanacetum cinerariifolium]
NSEPSLMHSARSQSTANGSKLMPRRNTQTSRVLPATKNSFVTTKTMPIAEHPKNSRNYSCVTEFLKEVNSRAKVPSNKTPKRNKPVEQISVSNKQERQIPTGQRFSIQKNFVVQKKTMTLRSCLRWKLTGKIFKTVGLRWVPIGKIFTSSTTKVDSEPQNGSNADITNQYECEQTLNLSACTSINPKEEGLRELDYDNPNLVPQRQDVYSSADAYVPSQQELDMLFGPLYDEFFNTGSNPSTNIQSTSSPSTHTNVNAEENNNDQAVEGEHTDLDNSVLRFSLDVAKSRERFDYFPGFNQRVVKSPSSESRPPMLNKENYVPWPSRLLRYAKSRLNGKLIHNSILNEPYVRKMIPELGDANRDITVTETFHLQTDDELSDKELKQIEAEDIYAAPEWSRHVTIVHQTKDLHTADYTQLYDFLKYNQKEMVGGNGGNQFRQYAGNPTGYNDVIGNQNQIGNGNVVAARAEGNAAGQNGNQIRCYNCREVGHYARNYNIRPRRMDADYLQTQLLIAQKEEAGIHL